MLEEDLFQPIKEYFEGFGYCCDGEVKSIDLYMEKGDENVAVELKVSLDFKAVQQAALRQKVADTVFIGIFTPKNVFSGAFRDKLYLLKRLGIGLITVSPRTGDVKVISEPVVSELDEFKSRNRKKRSELSQEFRRRTNKNNVGGVHSTKLMTGYREDTLLVLDAVCELGGEAPVREISRLCPDQKAAAILKANHYGWFEKPKKGIYRITEKGYDALCEYEKELGKLKAVQAERAREQKTTN